MLSDYLTLSIILLTLVILAVGALLYRKVGKVPDVIIDSEMMKGIITLSWKELGLDNDIGAIKTRADDIYRTSQGLENLFKVTRGRGEYGEYQLEHILKDILPSQYVHIRERLPFGIPDAHIPTPQGKILCMDSKFPCENYLKMLEATDEGQKAIFCDSFRSDVKRHIDSIREKYVKPEEGTTPFALGFIPSEAVYQYLTENEMALVAEAAKEGVLLVSPATVTVNLNLFSSGLRALEISERAEQIQRNLGRLSKSLEELGEAWSTLQNHISNAYNKSTQVNDLYNRLKSVFEGITEQEEA